MLVDNFGDGAYDRAGGVAVAIRLAQRVARRESFVAFATVRFEAIADGGIEFFVAVRVDEVVEVFQCGSFEFRVG
ncbi:MAG: hypothetical protein AB1720_09035 [Pseudomonadota bacterium]